MTVITISRELAALGDETARELAKLLGYRFIDKNTLEEKIKSYGIDEEKLKKYDEKKPSFFASLSHDRDHYMHYLKTAIYAEAEQDNCVFIGRGAGAILKRMPAHISVFLSAPAEIRIERVKSYFHCDDQRARQIIERSDQDRTGFHRYFFDIEWKEPGNYHLSLNTGKIHPADCALIIDKLKDKIFTQETSAQNDACLKDLILEQKIKNSILFDRQITVNFLEVKVNGNNVTIYGVASSQSFADTAVETAKEISESKQIKSEIQIVRDYSVIP